MQRFCLLLVFSPFAAYASLDDARTFLNDTYAPDRPGASVIIMQDGEIIHQEGYGLANVELGVPITPDSIFRIGSVTKQFTSAAIMLLQQRGELSVSDPIGKYLPEFPTHGHHMKMESRVPGTT